MRRIEFKDGKVVTTKLSVAETINRLNRLDNLRVYVIKQGKLIIRTMALRELST